MDQVWANRASSAEAAVAKRHLKRLWALPGTQLGMVGFPPTRKDLTFGTWHYWWQAHLLDNLVDAQLRDPQPARETRIEATLFNAGPNQEEAIAAFMAKPVMQADPLPPIGPLQRSNFRLSLQASRASIEQFEVGGRQLFVPVIAFNATYHWSSGAGQTSGSALLGRESGAEKLAPLRVDVGNGAFAGLGTRVLPTGVRR